MLNRNAGILIALLTAGLATSACVETVGQEKDPQAEECGQIFEEMAAIPQALDAYQSTGRETELKVPDVATRQGTATLQVEKEVSDPEILPLAQAAVAANRAFNAAQDTAAREKVIADFRPTLAGYKQACPRSGRSIKTAPLDRGLTPSTTAAPVPITPAGTKVAFGAPVTFEFTEPKDTGPVTMTVTEIVPIPGADLLRIDRNSRAKYGQLVYVRARAELAVEGGLRQPSLTLFEPQYAYTTSDNKPTTNLKFGDSWKACENKAGTATKELCQVVGIQPGSKITSVSVMAYTESAQASPTALYTWQQ